MYLEKIWKRIEKILEPHNIEYLLIKKTCLSWVLLKFTKLRGTLRKPVVANIYSQINNDYNKYYSRYISLTSRTIAFVSELVQLSASPSVQTRGWFTGDVLRVAIPTRVSRLTHTRVGPVGVEAPPVVTRSRTARAFEHVFSTSRAGEPGWTDAGEPDSRCIVSDATTSVSAGLGCAVVFVWAFFACWQEENGFKYFKELTIHLMHESLCDMRYVLWSDISL